MVHVPLFIIKNDPRIRSTNTRNTSPSQVIPPFLSLFTRFRPHLAHFFPVPPVFCAFSPSRRGGPTSPKDRPRWAGFLNDSAVPQTACCCPTSTPTARAQAGGAPASSAARMARAANPSLPSRASGGVSPTDWFRPSLGSGQETSVGPQTRRYPRGGPARSPSSARSSRLAGCWISS